MKHLACHPASTGPRQAGGLTIALAGNPNVGKSTFFNRVTGLETMTTNYPGTTVEVTTAAARVEDQAVTLVDLPGVYGLGGAAEDQRAAWDLLLQARPDAVVAILDATNLARNLYLVLQLLDLRLRVVVALNLSDAAEHAGIVIDARHLAELLGVPVVPTVATKGRGLAAVLAEAIKVAQQPATVDGPATAPVRGAALALIEGGARYGAPAAVAVARERHALAERIARKVTVSPGELRGRQAWHIATRPLTGLPLLLFVLAAIFTGLFWGGSLLAGLLDATWGQYVSPVIRFPITWLLGQGIVARTLLWGLDAGLNAVLSVGIPYVLTFYLMLALLEDTGYLNAATVLLDRVLGKIGLSGRAAIPLVAGAGCNVPAIIGLRVLRTERERLIAGTLITLVPCSARTAVIFGAVARFIGWPWALLLYGIVSAVILGAGWGLNRFIPGGVPDLLMEIFPFRMPALRTVTRKTWVRLREFIFVAVPIVLAGSLALGALYETGLMRLFARPLAPVVEGWLGLPAVAGLTLVFAVLRKELALQLLVALAVIQVGRGAENLLSFISRDQLFTYALVNTIYIPCIATIAVLTRALGRRRAVLISLGTVALAVFLGGVTIRLLRLF